MVRREHMSADEGDRVDDEGGPQAGEAEATPSQPEGPDAGPVDSDGAATSEPEPEPQPEAEGDARSASGPPADLGPPPPASVPLPPPLYSPKVSPTAEILDVMPDHGPTIGGTAVTITGLHLFRESIVRFGGEIARTTGAQEPRQLKVEAPPSKTQGSVDVTVQNPGAEVATLGKVFRYERLPAPVIASVAPNRLGVGGGEISITGSAFLSDTVVLLGDVEADRVVFVDATTLEVKVPAGASGEYVDVAVRNPDGQRQVARRAFVYDERYG